MGGGAACPGHVGEMVRPSMGRDASPPRVALRRDAHASLLRRTRTNARLARRASILQTLPASAAQARTSNGVTKATKKSARIHFFKEIGWAEPYKETDAMMRLLKQMREA